MLLLKRRRGETIRIGENIEVHILNYDGYQTKAGITAPRDIPVHRGGDIRTDQGRAGICLEMT